MMDDKLFGGGESERVYPAVTGRYHDFAFKFGMLKAILRDPGGNEMSSEKWLFFYLFYEVLYLIERTALFGGEAGPGRAVRAVAQVALRQTEDAAPFFSDPAFPPRAAVFFELGLCARAVQEGNMFGERPAEHRAGEVTFGDDGEAVLYLVAQLLANEHFRLFAVDRGDLGAVFVYLSEQ